MHTALDIYSSEVRGRIRVRGQVQGVGFRPFVYRIAGELKLSGWVRNDGEGVEIEVQGAGAEVVQLLKRLKAEAPRLARVDRVEYQSQPLRQGEAGFVIEASGGGRAATAIAPDTAICPECLAELFDPRDRRYRHPFINCTQCGPRYTLTRDLPYDRPNTSMARFAMCPACRAEYDAPDNRRFHAQPNACPECGPRLALLDASSEPLPGDPIAEALARIRAGEIVAIKGLGGFHLACDARDAAAVARLRQRKQREEKPFAVMVAGTAAALAWAEIGHAERSALESPERAVVLARKRPGTDQALRGIAPGLAWLGIMLPYAPIQYLLFHEAVGRPNGTTWLDAPHELALVMTSANPGGEPLVTGNDEARRRLAGIADAYLLHDRDILVRCDDSVVRCHSSVVSRKASDGGTEPPLTSDNWPLTTAFIRRARGWTPRAIKLAQAGPPVLALGGWFKNTVCLTRGDEAFVSQHIGDLDNAPTCRALTETALHLMEVLEIEPSVVAHDLHPDFYSSRFAADLARERKIPAVGVQHHHAHIAAVAAENGLEGPVLGLALDGVGLGADGAAWGGELLRVDGALSTRLAHLRPLALPGGDRAAREPWRMAASALHALGRGAEIETRFPRPAAATVRQMLERKINAPLTSSAGRLFDAAGGLLGVREVAAFEGQAPMLLEGLAESRGPVAPMEEGFRLGDDGTLDFLPLLAAVADLKDPADAASLFHSTVAEGLAQWVLEFSRRHGLRRVACGGGCFLNHVLSSALRARLQAAGLEVFEAAQVPPNDGGLSLGQAWVAMRSGSAQLPTDD
ncbi:MAG TPA: carbamoyltransferase HypF [Burkholderiales bacterium]|nr:carbamoyltransferase HypF [Burkholderiales bacterium]